MTNNPKNEKQSKKAVWGITLISLFGIGCKKDTASPTSGKSGGKKGVVKPLTGPDQVEKKFTITSDTFKDMVVDHDLLRENKINLPHLSWENIPMGTKGFYIIMDNDKGHVYFNKEAAGRTRSLKAEILKKIINPMSPQKNDALTATIEIFALNCTPDQFRKSTNKGMEDRRISLASRATIKEILKESGLSSTILGSAIVEYKIKK